MKLRAYHVWIATLPTFVAALLLPVTRVGPSEISGLTSAWQLPILSLWLTAISLFLEPGFVTHYELWLVTSYGMVIVLVVLSPLFIFTRAFAARCKVGLILCGGQVVLFIATFLGPLFWSENTALPFEFLGYWAFGAGLAILSIAYVIRIKEVEPIHPPDGVFRCRYIHRR